MIFQFLLNRFSGLIKNQQTVTKKWAYEARRQRVIFGCGYCWRMREAFIRIWAPIKSGWLLSVWRIWFSSKHDSSPVWCGTPLRKHGNTEQQHLCRGPVLRLHINASCSPPPRYVAGVVSAFLGEILCGSEHYCFPSAFIRIKYIFHKEKITTKIIVIQMIAWLKPDSCLH